MVTMTDNMTMKPSDFVYPLEPYDTLVYVEAQKIQEWIVRKLDELEARTEEVCPNAYDVGLLTGEFEVLRELKSMVKQFMVTTKISRVSIFNS